MKACITDIDLATAIKKENQINFLMVIISGWLKQKESNGFKLIKKVLTQTITVFVKSEKCRFVMMFLSL